MSLPEVMLVTCGHNAACRCSSTSCYYLRARRGSKEAMEYSLPASLSADTAAAVAEEATFLGLPELLATSWCRVEELQPLEYVYNFKTRQKYDLESKGIPSGWELVSANSIAGDKDYMLVICRHPDGEHMTSPCGRWVVCQPIHCQDLGETHCMLLQVLYQCSTVANGWQLQSLQLEPSTGVPSQCLKNLTAMAAH